MYMTSDRSGQQTVALSPSVGGKSSGDIGSKQRSLRFHTEMLNYMTINESQGEEQNCDDISNTSG
jgi:hypothetical protein